MKVIEVGASYAKVQPFPETDPGLIATVNKIPSFGRHSIHTTLAHEHRTRLDEPLSLPKEAFKEVQRVALRAIDEHNFKKARAS